LNPPDDPLLVLRLGPFFFRVPNTHGSNRYGR
jgi:hypothetical protein